MRKQTADGGRTVIVPNHSEIGRGTLKSIIEQSDSLAIHSCLGDRTDSDF
jgi:hypothetical protein